MILDFLKQKNIAPEARVARCLAGKDYAGLARTYYDMGRTCMDRGDLERAMLWLGRADTVYSARDEVYESVGEKLADDCGDRIGRLEEAPLMTNDVLFHMAGRAAELGSGKVRVWGLFTLARLCVLGTRLAALPGCQVLGNLGRCTDLVLKSLQGPLAPGEMGEIRAVSDGLYELSDSEDFFAGGEIPTRTLPFQVFDLNGMQTLLELNGYLDAHLAELAAPGSAAAEMGLIPCALLADYYRRTVPEDIRSLPQIEDELRRIWGDYDFLRRDPSWEEISRRAAEYQQLDLLG